MAKDPTDPGKSTEPIDPKVPGDPVTPPKDPDPKDPGPKDPPATDPLDHKLEGDNIPEQYRGKTVKDIMETLNENNNAVRTLQLEVDTLKVAAAPVTPKDPPYDPEEALDPAAYKAIQAMVAQGVAGVQGGFADLTKQLAKARDPEFSKFEKRADEVYKSLEDKHKFDPKYGWDFALNVAKAEEASKQGKTVADLFPIVATPPATPPPKDPATAPLSEEEARWAKIQGLTPEEYRKYATVRRE